MSFLINPYAFGSAAPPPFVPWTPAEQAHALWYDPSDSTTVTLVSSALSQLNDKSGNARNVTQATSGSRPAMTTINGLDAILWNGTSHRLANATNIVIHYGPWTADGVMRGRDANNGILLAQQAVVGVGQYLRQTVTPERLGAIIFRQSGNEGNFVAVDNAGFALLGARYTGTAVAASLDGTENTPTATANLPTVGADRVTLGDITVSSANSPFEGESGEILLIAGGLSLAMRQRRQGYLAHKWGLASQLDVSHPYKASPPPTGFLPEPGSWTAGGATGFSGEATQKIFSAIHSGARVWILVGNNDKLSTSPDGATWTARTAGMGANINGIDQAHDGRINIVADGFNLMRTSTDGGATWGAVTHGASVSLRDIAHNKIGLWVYVGDSGFMRSSTNGTSWTTRTSQFGTTRIWGVCFGDGLWIAVGEDGKLSTSENGTTWTARTSSFGTTTIRKVVRANGLAVAVGHAGKIATSRDGITWTQRTSGTSEDLFRVIYCDGAFIALGSNNVILYSEDGIAWVPWTPPASGNTWGAGYNENGRIMLSLNASDVYYADR